MTTKLSILKAQAERAEYRAKLAARRAERAQAKIERERLKRAIVEYRARRAAYQDSELIRRQSNRVAALARLLAAPGYSAPREVLIKQVRAAIEREADKVAAAQARTIFTQTLQ